jgi:hypothetical protein
MITCTHTTVDPAFRARGEGTRDKGLPPARAQTKDTRDRRSISTAFWEHVQPCRRPATQECQKTTEQKTDRQGVWYWEADNNMRRGQENASKTRRSEAEWSRIGSQERLRNQFEACGARHTLQRAGTAEPDINGSRNKNRGRPTARSSEGGRRRSMASSSGGGRGRSRSRRPAPRAGARKTES